MVETCFSGLNSPPEVTCTYSITELECDCYTESIYHCNKECFVRSVCVAIPFTDHNTHSKMTYLLMYYFAQFSVLGFLTFDSILTFG